MSGMLIQHGKQLSNEYSKICLSFLLSSFSLSLSCLSFAPSAVMSFASRYFYMNAVKRTNVTPVVANARPLLTEPRDLRRHMSQSHMSHSKDLYCPIAVMVSQLPQCHIQVSPDTCPPSRPL